MAFYDYAIEVVSSHQNGNGLDVTQITQGRNKYELVHDTVVWEDGGVTVMLRKASIVVGDKKYSVKRHMPTWIREVFEESVEDFFFDELNAF